MLCPYDKTCPEEKIVSGPIFGIPAVSETIGVGREEGIAEEVADGLAEFVSDGNVEDATVGATLGESLRA